MIAVDIWRAAHLMIARHADQAELQAAMKADEMLERNDPAGVTAWKNIMETIRELKRATPSGAENRQ